MIEKTVIDYLSAFIPTFAEAPEHPPEDGRYCIVERTGSGRENQIRSATLAVRCHADTMAGAAALCEQVEGWMEGLAALPSIARCALNSSFNNTDDRKKQYRYQAVFSVVYY